MMTKTSNLLSEPAHSQAGTDHNLPSHVRDAANLRSPVLAWTHLDPRLEGELGRALCVAQCCFPFLLPCFWPHFIVCWPFVWTSMYATKERVKAQYWILTTTELRLVTLDHDTCCIPGCNKSGTIVKTIPLENITNVGQDARGKGCLNHCAGDIPIIYVDTASSMSGKGREASGMGLQDFEWFIQQILNQRDVIKGRTAGHGMPYYNTPEATAIPMEDRGSISPNKTAAERLKDIAQLRDQGLITLDDFEKKKAGILASL